MKAKYFYKKIIVPSGKTCQWPRPTYSLSCSGNITDCKFYSRYGGDKPFCEMFREDLAYNDDNGEITAYKCNSCSCAKNGKVAKERYS
jgi:hypothetical protein